VLKLHVSESYWETGMAIYGGGGLGYPQYFGILIMEKNRHILAKTLVILLQLWEW